MRYRRITGKVLSELSPFEGLLCAEHCLLGGTLQALLLDSPLTLAPCIGAWEGSASDRSFRWGHLDINVVPYGAAPSSAQDVDDRLEASGNRALDTDHPSGVLVKQVGEVQACVSQM